MPRNVSDIAICWLAALPTSTRPTRYGASCRPPILSPSVVVFCDNNDTHTASISYFAYVRLERR